EGVMIDPAIDFCKNTWHSLEILRRLSELVNTGWPVLMAMSNKGGVGETLNVGLEDRLLGTLAASALAADAGAVMVRAHEVGETRQTLEMVSSVAAGRPPAQAVRYLAGCDRAGGHRSAALVILARRIWRSCTVTRRGRG